jgi:hypothetical protein
MEGSEPPFFCTGLIGLVEEGNPENRIRFKSAKFHFGMNVSTCSLLAYSIGVISLFHEEVSTWISVLETRLNINVM